MKRTVKTERRAPLTHHSEKEDNLISIFARLKAILKQYENFLQPKFDLDSKYDLWSFKEVEIAGRKRKEIYFAGLIIQSSYVRFYYMPVYVDTKLQDVFEPELLKLLTREIPFFG